MSITQSLSSSAHCTITQTSRQATGWLLPCLQPCIVRYMALLGTEGLAVCRNTCPLSLMSFLKVNSSPHNLAMQKSPGSTGTSGSTRISIPSGKLGRDPAGAVIEWPSTSSQKDESLAFLVVLIQHSASLSVNCAKFWCKHSSLNVREEWVFKLRFNRLLFC